MQNMVTSVHVVTMSLCGNLREIWIFTAITMTFHLNYGNISVHYRNRSQMEATEQ